MIVKKGEIYYADLSLNIGSEQGGVRPVIIIQNDIGNFYSPTTIVAPITSRFKKNMMPTHIRIKSDCLPKKSIVMLEQIRTIDKSRLTEKVGEVNKTTLAKINRGLCISLDCQKGRD
jgi:mRNA interferase MazF